MKSQTFVAFGAGLVVGLLVASASEVRFGGPTAADERKRCAELLRRRSEWLRGQAAEEVERDRKRGLEPPRTGLNPYERQSDDLDNLREGIESGAAAP